MVIGGGISLIKYTISFMGMKLTKGDATVLA